MKKNIIKILMIIAGTVLYSIGLKWFVYVANILPSGTIGASTLIQKIILDAFKIEISITPINTIINLIPAIFCFMIVGKRYTIISYIIMFFLTFVADHIPIYNMTSDPLIAAIFGGIICGFGSSLIYRCGVSGGGTDFVAMTLSTKWHIQTFGYIMAFNMLLIFIQGLLYGWEHAFHSIIYQYVSTTVLNACYRHFEARTLFIITDKPTLVSKMLIKATGHSATMFAGKGCYTMNDKYMLHTIITQPELKRVTEIIVKADPNAFINVIQSRQVAGNFLYLPVDNDDIDQNYSKL